MGDFFIDTIVLISGDGDFIPLIDYLKSRGRQVEIISFGPSTSNRLKEVADDFIDLSDEPKRFTIPISKRLGILRRKKS